LRTQLIAAALGGGFVLGLLQLDVLQTQARAQTQLERGSYLVNTIMACGNCHSPRDAQGKLTADNALSGGLKFVTPAFVATAPNITPDPETGLGTPGPEYKMPVAREPYPDAERGFAPASFSDPVTHGKYLATIGHCMECHAAWSRGVSDFNNGLGRGGRPFGPALVQGFGPDWQGAIATNITSDRTAGIGSWTDDEIARAITKGIGRDGRALKPPMAYSFYAGLRMETLGTSLPICGPCRRSSDPNKVSGSRIASVAAPFAA
jgi:mono/diheme cytochrome c family protein